MTTLGIRQVTFGLFLAVFAFAHAQTPLERDTPATTTNTTHPTTTTTSPVTTAPTTTTAPAPPPIPLAAINADVERATKTIKEIDASLTPDLVNPPLADDLPAFSRELDARLIESRNVLAAQPTLETVRTLGETYDTFHATLTEWKEDLTRRAQKLDRDVLRMAELGKEWHIRTTQAKESASPPEVIKRLEDFLDTIYRTWADAEQARKQILGLQTQVGEQDNRVTDVLASVRVERDKAVGRLLAKDASPIWSPQVRHQSAQNLLSAGQNSFGNQVTALVAYAQRMRVRFIAHGLIVVLIVAVLFWVRRLMRVWLKDEPNLKHAFVVFNYPIPTGMVLGVLASASIYPQAPRLLWAFLGAAMLIPAVFLLRKLLERPFYSLLTALVVLYFVDQLRAVTISQPMLNRLIFLTEMAGAFVFTLAMLKSGRISHMMERRSPPLATAVRVGARITGVLFLAAFAAAAVGYVGLGLLLGNATLISFRIGVIFFTAVQIIDGLILGFLRIWPLTLMRMVVRHRPLIHQRLALALRWAAFVAWFLFTLDLFAIRGIVLDRGHRFFTATLTWGSFNLSLWNLISFGVTVWAAFAISRFIRFLLQEDIFPRVQLAPGLPYAVSNIVHYVVLIIGFFAAVSALGYDLSKFTILAGAFGVGLGFGLQNIVNNFVSGIILLFERPVKVGDVVQFGDQVGTVSRIGIRASTVRTSVGSNIIVPNAQLISDRVINWTLSSRQRGLSLTVSVATGTNASQVIELLQNTASAHPLVAEKPDPQALLTAFNANLMTFELQVWTKAYEDWSTIRSDLGIQIMEALRLNNIELR